MLYRVGCLLDAELVAFWALLPLIHRLCAGFANTFIDQNRNDSIVAVCSQNQFVHMLVTLVNGYVKLGLCAE